LAVKTCRLAITAGSKGCSIAPDKSDFKEEKISTLYFCISQVVCKLKEKEKIDVKFGKICRQPVLINWTGIGKQGKRKYFNFL